MTDLDQYQEWTRITAIYPNVGSNLIYPTLGLVGESGEVANKVKKIERDMEGVISQEMRYKIANELGDVLWYLARLADELKIPLSVIATQNRINLTKRMTSNNLKGEGDDR